MLTKVPALTLSYPFAGVSAAVQVCRLLLQSGADASKQDADGQTAQQLAPSSWTCWQ